MDKINIDKVFAHGELDRDVLDISWSLTEYCNYQCSYCCAKAINISKSSNFYSFQVYKRVIDRLFLLNKYKYNFMLAGGEPTVNPYLLDIVRYLNISNKNIYLEIITNASNNINLYSNIFDNTNNIDFTLKISVHLEYVKNTKKIEEILQLANKKNKKIVITIMLHPELIENRNNIYNELMILKEKYSFSLYLDEIFEGPTYTSIDSRYDNEYLEWITYTRNKNLVDYKPNSNLYDFESKYYMFDGSTNIINNYESVYLNKKSFLGFYCCLGLRAISIWADGSCSGAECSVGERQNIYSDIFDWIKFTQYKKCTNMYCRCRANNSLPKFRDEEEAKKLMNMYRESINYFIISDIIEQVKQFYTNNKNYEDNTNNIISNIEVKINTLVDFIYNILPFKRWRNIFKNKITEQNRTEQNRTEQNRTEQNIYKKVIYKLYLNNTTQHQKLQPMLQYVA